MEKERERKYIKFNESVIFKKFLCYFAEILGVISLLKCVSFARQAGRIRRKSFDSLS